MGRWRKQEVRPHFGHIKFYISEAPGEFSWQG
jgi:hypothetical protein